MRVMTLQMTFLLLVSAPVSVFARNVQQAECVGPAGAPIKAIYLHGWFPPKGNGGFVGLEGRNRNQLEQLAKQLGIRIAIPLAPNIHPGNGNREWPNGMGAAANNSLRAIEAQASRVCGAPLAPGRTLFGFSNGGFAARNIAMSCDEHLKNNYSGVIMMGAKAWANPPNRNFAGCPKLTAMAGTQDDVRTCVKGGGCRSFKDVATQMRRGLGGNVDIESYNGGHVLAPNDRLAQLLGRSGAAQLTGSTQFILTLPGATK